MTTHVKWWWFRVHEGKIDFENDYYITWGDVDKLAAQTYDLTNGEAGVYVWLGVIHNEDFSAYRYFTDPDILTEVWDEVGE